MADTDKLRNYARQEQPTLDGNERKYLALELRKIQTSIDLLVSVTKQLETRMTAHGI